MFSAELDCRDRSAARACDARTVLLLRIGLGVVFLWFGALKLCPGLSPAEGLIARTVCCFIDPDLFLPLLAVWECVIGIGLLTRRFLRLTLVLLGLHMAGTFLPLVMCPEEVWTRFPYAWTLEGQYILKNLVLIGAGVAVACGADRRRRSPQVTNPPKIASL